MSRTNSHDGGGNEIEPEIPTISAESPVAAAATSHGDPEKAAGLVDDGAPPAESEPVRPKSNWNKPVRFYLSYLALTLMVFVVSLDITIIGTVIPVSYLSSPVSYHLSVRRSS
jgi:hypothetical protein